MANVNSVADVIRRQNNGQPLVLQLATQGHFAFQVNGANAVLSAPNPLALADVGVESPVGNANATAIPITLAACGLISSTARGQQYQMDVNFGTGLSPAIATTGLVTIPGGAGAYVDNWGLVIEAMWDATSQNLRGIYYGWVGNAAVAQAALNGAPSAAAVSGLQFTCAVTMPGATVGTTTFTLTEFSLDLE